ncbi:Kelch-like protein 2 [Seminavis robusta]|uniref:Kelch-like protein 2 n=1 Tax=Seminavis robusta TaxID=568900 RepID=A0A9N8DZN5_9STRA|nr:Kelch-like protein 2 [Seminavis robusta]|eukprot:Sro405_g136050.1 Kelch-like protein 2 (423) ;mRNA; r:13315-14583
MEGTTMHNSRDKEISINEMLQSFLTDEALNDVTLRGTDGVEVPANRFLLSARSQVFRGMLLGKFQEALSSVVEVGFKGGTLRAVVEYILTDSAQMLNCKKRKSQEGRSFDYPLIQSFVSLLEAAAYFQLPGLVKRIRKKLELIWWSSPCSSFAILQACKMAEPKVPATLVEEAWRNIRRPFSTNSITQEHVDCLSVDILKEILTDEAMEKTEYQLFQILNLWAQGKESERLMTAKGLSQHICFGRIKPELLATTVAASGLVTPEQLLEAYKYQAFAAKEISSDVFSHKRNNPWMTHIQTDKIPTEIKVTGAGSRAVNGVYVRDGLFRGHCKYTKNGQFGGQPCVFWLRRCGAMWEIMIPDEDVDVPGAALGAKKFYFVVGGEQDESPPPIEWHCYEFGRGPVPKVKYRFASSGSGNNSDDSA